jgi:hypothetical protein
VTEETTPLRSAEPRSLTRRRLITGTLKFGAGAGAALLGSGVIVSATPASAVTPSQPDWRYCQICKALVYNSAGACPGSPTGHNRSGSFNYWIPYNGQGNTYFQTGWKWCNKCQMLAYGGGSYLCPAGNYHNQGGSYNYGLVHDLGASASMQQGWVYCGRCGGLYFKSERPTSICAGNGFFAHQENGSYGYQLEYGWVE